MKYFICALFFVLVIPIAMSWDWDTHEALARRLCDDFSCNCSVQILNGSIVPDKYFHDNVKHHYYNPENCTRSMYYVCPFLFDNITLEKSHEWLLKARNDTGCARWYDIGVASHYFFDSKSIWHQVEKEDSKCHSGFETKVGEKFKANVTNWQVCECGKCVYSENFTSFIKEFEQQLNFTNQTITMSSTRPKNVFEALVIIFDAIITGLEKFFQTIISPMA